MFLLARPPLLRWVLAVGLVIVALWADLRPASTVEHPFARTDLETGTEVTAADVEMVEVPVGVFEPVELPMLLARPVASGDPVLTSSASVDRVSPPEGWLLVELAVPAATHPGSVVVAVVSDTEDGAPRTLEGVVVSTAIDDGFGTNVATCAFPAADAGVVAVAAAENRISILVGS